MKDYVLTLAASRKTLNEKLNMLREYLQAYVLRIFHDEGFFRTTAFVGGTALRFLHDLPRFSEDLDFSLEKPGNYSFVDLMKKTQSELVASGYQIEIKYDDQKTVYSAFIKFEELLFEAGISPLKSQKFSIKVEIDTRPPKGARLETKIVNKFFPISFLTYDITSLFAGKFHALLTRPYVKGRDFFDLGWYLSRFKNIEPNMDQLLNALRQTGWKQEFPAENNWREFLGRVVEKTDWKKVRPDVENFLERPTDLNIFTKENILELLKTKSTGSQ